MWAERLAGAPEFTLRVLDGCRMYGGFTDDRDIRIVVADGSDGASVVFERFALERFAGLAHELLAVPAYEEEPANLPVLVSPSSSDAPAVPSLTAVRGADPAVGSVGGAGARRAGGGVERGDGEW